MIYVTGDVHGSNGINKLNDENFPEAKFLAISVVPPSKEPLGCLFLHVCKNKPLEVNP